MKNLFSSLFLALILTLFSCTKKNETSPPPVGTNTPSNPETDKSAVQKAGVDFVKEISQLESTSGIQTSIQFFECMQKNDSVTDNQMTKSLSANPTFTILKSLIGFSEQESGINNLFKSMEMEEPVDDTMDIEKEFNKMVGIYTWNASLSKFDSTGSVNSIVFKFPGRENDETNTASLTISDFTVSSVTIDGKLTKMPSGIMVSLAYNNVIEISISGAATYASDRPTSISTTLTLYPFSWTVSVANNAQNTNASAEYKWLNGTKNIITLKGSAEGNWSEQSLTENIHTSLDSNCMYQEYNETSGKYECVSYNVYESDSVALDLIITKVNASYQLFDVKIEGFVNSAQMYKDMEVHGNTNFANDSLRVLDEMKIMNKNIVLQAKLASSNKLIADIVPYLDQEQKEECHWDYIFNGEYSQPVYVCNPYTDYYVNMRFKFADGSLVDFETYLQNGFTDLEAEINKFMNEMNDKHGLNLEPIKFNATK